MIYYCQAELELRISETDRSVTIYWVNIEEILDPEKLEPWKVKEVYPNTIMFEKENEFKHFVQSYAKILTSKLISRINTTTR